MSLSWSARAIRRGMGSPTAQKRKRQAMAQHARKTHVTSGMYMVVPEDSLRQGRFHGNSLLDRRYPNPLQCVYLQTTDM